MANNTIGIIDEPNPRGNEDTLDINHHASALTNFIKMSTTPITIGIQGEWGSGKTSLLNAIYHNLDNDGIYKQIWINSWEHSLLTTPEESLLKIVNEIIHEMLETDQKMDRKNNIRNIATTVFKGALRIGATAVAGKEAVEVTDELMGDNVNGIKELREQLNELANEIKSRDTNPVEKIIIYVDDLDRIEPKDAVQVLELLKNIFSIPNCIFLLAIDYQVVVKGLEHKFGKQDDNNEWEFRAFFDKIIQLPFMMPMGQYNISKYVMGLLKEVGFVDETDQYNQDFNEQVKKILIHSIGSNPRSIKRLVNSLSLINIFTKIKNQSKKNIEAESEINQVRPIVMFGLVCLQISYPYIYELLIKETSFWNWSDSIIFKQIGNSDDFDKEKFEEDFQIAKETDDFNEDWEKSLYTLCYPKPRYRSRATDISRLLNYIKNEILKKYQEETLKNIISEIVDDTVVTSVSSTDDDMQIKLPKRDKGSFKRMVFENVEMTMESAEKVLNYPQEKISDFKKIHDDINFKVVKDFKGCKVDYYEWGISIKSSRKFLTLESFKNKKTHRLFLLKTHKNEYKIPKIEKLGIRHVRPYSGLEKPDSAAECEAFKIDFDSYENYTAHMDAIYKLIDISFDMVNNHDDKILEINPKTGNVKSYIKNIENDKIELDKFAKKVLNDDYYYEL